jgi:hypothetical protein
MTELPAHIANNELRTSHVPPASADWTLIWSFAYTFNGFKVHGSFEACAAIANEQRHETLTDLRTCLFFEARRWHHYGDDPDEEAAPYIRSLVQQIHDRVSGDRPQG